jgi:hypothetical protein
MGLWGGIEGIVNGPLFALFADSTPQGYYLPYYCQKFKIVFILY